MSQSDINIPPDVDTGNSLSSLEATVGDDNKTVKECTKRTIVRYERNELLELSTRRLSRQKFSPPGIPSLTKDNNRPSRMNIQQKSFESGRGRRASEVTKPVAFRGGFTQSQRKIGLGNRQDHDLSRAGTSRPSWRTTFGGTGDCDNNVNRFKETKKASFCKYERNEGSKLIYKKLEDILSKEPDAAVVALSCFSPDFSSFVSKPNIGKDLLILAIQIIGQKLCSDDLNLKQLRNPLLAVVCAPDFLKQLKVLTNNLAEEEEEETFGRRPGGLDKSPFRVLTDLMSFYNVVWLTMPNFATDHFLMNIKAAKNSSMILKLSTMDDVLRNSYTNLESEFMQLESSILERKRQIEEQQKTGQENASSGPRLRIGISKAQVERLYMANPPEDFRTISVTPKKEELLTDENPFLRPSIERGSYPSSDVYLDVQFRLLREDFIHPLREGIRDYLQNSRDYSGRKKKMPFGTVRIYRDVRFVNKKFDGFTTVYSLQFPAEKFKNIRWDMSKRLITGSLLCLTPDKFQNVYLATVATPSFRRNEDLSQGILDVIWEGDRKPEMNKNVSYLMMECEVYFEAYRHTLSALQNIDLDNYPMKKYIVDAKYEGILPPSYLETTDKLLIFDAMLKKDCVLWCADNYNATEENNTEKYSSESEEKVEEPKFKVQPLDSDEWPSAADLGMDDSQYSAFVIAITNELSVIQGPPGTGKTFIGLQIAKLILNNPQIYDTGYPILIVCYTNHALDQFLEGIIDLMEAMDIDPLENLIRIGSRSKLERLEPYNIRERMKYAVSVNNIFEEEYYYLNARSSAFRTLKNLQRCRNTALDELKGLYNIEGIIDFSELCVSEELQLLCPTSLGNLFFVHLERWNLMDGKSMMNNNLTFKWLGLTDDNFHQKHFDPMQQLRKIFKVLTSNIETLNKKQNPSKFNKKILPASVEKVPVNENDQNIVEEEFDMDELMSHRYETENQTETNKREQHELSYAISISASEKYIQILQAIQQDNSEILKKLYAGKENREQNLALCKSIKEDLSSETSWLNNVKNFLVTLMNALRNKWIDLPAVTPELLTRASEINVLAEDGEEEIFQLDEKWALYFYLTREARKLTEKRIVTLEQEIMEAQTKYKEVNTLGEAMLLKTARFVGMTTTGAAKYSTLLRMMQSPIVIVEEAAEVLEAHIVTSITKYCEHLILIGDHKQLRPTTNVYKMSKEYNLDISLFERFINNNVSSCQLKIQHRMRPNICKLLVPTIYEDLQNHESVLEYPRVLGVTKSLFFVTHTEEETVTEDSATKTNMHEAKFLVKLCRYLILQGYKPGQITIITTYLGQMFLLKDLKKEEGQTCQGVCITVVDNFQGEENDIILLSLVRSNPENKIGFLKTDNRICVALSRARHALFIVANMQCLLASGSPTWEKINQELQNEGNIGSHLELKCETHGNVTVVQTSTDFDKVPEGGCSQMCNRALACGHNCQLFCHPWDRDHIEYQCVLPCSKSCPNGHPCPTSCYMNCGKCTKLVNKKLPCGHEEFLECHIFPSAHLCHKPINKSLPCGHAQISNCYEKVEDIRCKKLLPAKMPNCGHQVEVECFKKDTEELWECSKDCDRRLPFCGHTCGGKCHMKNDPDHENHVCKKTCGRTCENDHTCQGDHECRYKCPSCEQITTKTLQCGHPMDVECYVHPDSILCQKLCNRVLDCGHECLLKCSEDCKCMVTVKRPSISCEHEIEAYCHQTPSKEICEMLVDSKVLSACGHKVKIPCKIELNATAEDCLQYCENPCDEILGTNENGQCEHRCTGNCFQCHQGRIHKRCAEKCERSLACGHFCKFPCAFMCPCCTETCYFKCEHSKCVQKCGFPCLGCNERCGWSCSHAKCTKLCREKCDREPCDKPCTNVLKCGHNCIGLCGEICPTLCKICDAEEVQEILFGEEDDPNARFVFLEDCGHAIEVKGMDQYMKTVIVVDGVSVKKCPKCSTVIRNNRRYGTIMNAMKKDIVAIKKKIQGYDEIIERKMEKIVNALFKCRNESILNSFREFLAERSYTVHGKKKTLFPNTIQVDQYLFESLDNMMEWWTAARKNLTENELRPEDKMDLSDRYERFFNIIMQRLLPLSRKEIMDLEREFEKMSAWWKLYRRYAVIQIVPTIPGVPEKLEQLTNFLESIQYQKYTKTVETEFKFYLKEFDQLIVKQIYTWKAEEMNPETRSLIFKAVGFGANHWCKCPNGHLYVIADCGRPNQISTCPQCKSVIGGENHEFVHRNTVATEEDILLPLSNLPDVSFLENSQI